MKQHLRTLLEAALLASPSQPLLSPPLLAQIHVERTDDPRHGDFTSNLALVLAKPLGLKPRDLATQVIQALPPDAKIAAVEIAGPGFINFRLTPEAYHAVLHEILDAGARYGGSNLGKNQRVIIEFVSSNPTGPLHVGHGRGAAYGATLSNLLEAVGFQVHREYYVNDAGRQVQILALSLWLRYLELHHIACHFPTDAYRGDYVTAIAERLKETHGDRFCRAAEPLFNDLPPDADQGGDKDAYVDALIQRAQSLLGTDDFQAVLRFGLDLIVADMRDDLAEFGVVFQEWFPESRLYENGDVSRSLEKLRTNDCLYRRDGAEWFRATEFGDDKDRVVVRENGRPTYFASDIAYHVNKYERGFDHIIDILGSDHHGYAPRIRAFLQAEGLEVAKFAVLLVQFVNLYRGKEKIPMSTRAGSFVTLRALRGEVGNDAARFFYILRHHDQHLDFDLALAKSQTADNPVYYVQYAHARICSVFRQLAEKGWPLDLQAGSANLHRLTTAHEQALMRQLSRYPEVIELAAVRYEPHLLAHSLQALANDFHTYYNAHQFLVEEAPLRQARLVLVRATQQVLRNGLSLLGVSAPETM